MLNITISDVFLLIN